VQRRKAILTVDFEDYRRQELRDHLSAPQPGNPDEVERQLDLLLSLFESCAASATFFAVGRLARELPKTVWPRIIRSHRLGCHGHEHERVSAQGPSGFRRDLADARHALEDAAGVPVVSYRAPYFSADDCDPWFGEILAESGFRIDSSRRLAALPSGSVGTVPLAGAEGTVTEVPLHSVGIGEKRLTIVGGTYFRLLPLFTIRRLLARAEARGFLPVLYLHPYDVDASAAPLAYPGYGHWKRRAGDWVRRRGRATAGEKLRALCDTYAFVPAESLAS
jgi:peptidoglycan/xylan/chitin deacetylase (PgdA/CDA1 family)